MSSTTTSTTTLLAASSVTVRAAESPASYKYARFLPHYAEQPKMAPLEPFEHVDIGKEALTDAEPRSFLKNAVVNEISPKFGLEVVEGVDLTTLDRRERAQLALLVAQKGVVVFRNQNNFVDADPRWQIDDFGASFGRIHFHPATGPPKDYPEFHVVYYETDGHKVTDRNGGLYLGSLNRTSLHSDVSYEMQASHFFPGRVRSQADYLSSQSKLTAPSALTCFRSMTCLFLYETPESGGDTLYIDTEEAYNRLSPSFAAYLETLSAEHSGHQQAAVARSFRGEAGVRREPVANIHPVIRRHPVTGKKSIYVNKGFTTRVVGLKAEESKAILDLLFNHLAAGHDFMIRARWAKNTVVCWDNRRTGHSALLDFDENVKGMRHGARITMQAERPSL
ncbi:hypothetical protein JCM10207_000371 [Rhodosporidiobolus poonsookiae]